MRDPFRNYDSWLESGFQQREAEADRLRCPDCDDQMQPDDDGFLCPACGHSEYPVEP